MASPSTRIVFMGTPDYVVPVLECLTTIPNAEVVGVYTPPDRPRGRGRPTEMPPIKEFALSRGLKVWQPASLRREQEQRELQELKPDVVVVAAYGKLLPTSVLSTPHSGCLNLHPSLLPRYRGPSPVATAILDGQETTGVSLMLLDEGMDTGPILSQRRLQLSGEETAQSLTPALFRLGAELLLECLEPWLEGKITPANQDGSFATVTRKLERTDGQADWNQAAADLERRRRAFTPWPGLFTLWEGKMLKLLEVAALPNEAPETSGTAAEAGRVVLLDTRDFPVGVVTAEGILGLKNIQLEGRRPQEADGFLRGYPGFLGARL